MNTQQSINAASELPCAFSDGNLEMPSYFDLSTTPVLGNSTVPTEISQISNADFIAALFPILPEQASALVCSKRGDPTDGGWVALPAEHRVKSLSASANNFVNCASFRADSEGELRAQKSNSVATHFIMLDDVGTKVPLARLANFKLSWLLRTSPKNYQAGIIFECAVTDQVKLAQLLNAIIGAGLCDPGATGPATRWVRLPQGINGKPKHKSRTGEPFRCQLVRWNPERRYTIDQIVEGLGLSPLVASNAAFLGVSKGVSPAPVPKDSDSQRCMLVELKALLAVLDADCGYRDWLIVLMAIYHSTDGSDEGLALADAWSRTSDKYKGPKELEIKWRSFNGGTQNPVTIRTMRNMAASSKGAAVFTSSEIAQSDDDEFEMCQTVVVSDAQSQPALQKVAPHPLGKYSISDDIEALERQMVEQVPMLGNLALMGQATAIFAAPNTGKTLLTMRLLTDAIDKKALDPNKLFYLNMDDNGSGLVEKVKIASEYGFEMLADSYKGFEPKDFRKAMETMIETSTARGVVIVIDTLKKFVDTMDKGRSSDFSKVIRRFCLQGGTVIVLGHTNKNPGANGKKVYAGTTDIVDDFDCAYILDTLKVQPEPGWKVVEFENIKRRGNVEASVTYRYRNEPGTSYDAMLLSVKEEDYSTVLQLKETAEIQSEMPIVDALRDAIAEGISTKMKLIKSVAKTIALSERIVGAILEKYAGTDSAKHYWQFVVGARGAKSYALIGHDGEETA